MVSTYHSLFNSLPIERHQCAFQFLATMNKSAMNIYVWVLHEPVSLPGIDTLKLVLTAHSHLYLYWCELLL